MRNPFLNNPLRDKVRPKFRGKQTLAPRQDPRFPDHLVRDYDRITNAAMVLLHRLLRQKLPQIRRLFEQSTRLDADGDTTFDTLFFDLTVEFERDFLRFGLAGKLAALAERTRKLTVREWKTWSKQPSASTSWRMCTTANSSG